MAHRRCVSNETFIACRSSYSAQDALFNKGSLSLSFFFPLFFFFGGAILRRINVAIVHQDLYYIYKIPHRVSRSVLCTCVLSTEQYVHGLYDGIEVEKKVVIAAIQSATPSLLLPSANVVTSKDRGGYGNIFLSVGWVDLTMPYYFGRVGQFCALHTHTRNAANAVKWPIEFVYMMQR